MTTAAQPPQQRLEDTSGVGRWIAEQRDQGATWIDITVELNISEPAARTLERQYLDEIADRERERQHTLW